MNGLSFTFARVGGAPIQAHISLLLLFFIFLSPAVTVPQPEQIGFTRLELISLSLATALVFIVTILLHELGHVFQARRENMEVHGVTLWALGGVAYLSGGTPSPGQEFRVAVAGPAVTALLAVLLGAISYLAPEQGPIGEVNPALGVADIVGRAQIFLLAFNLVPAYPLDGGRIFFALVWRLRDNMTSALKTASALGKGFGVILMLLGGLTLLSRQVVALLPAIFRINAVSALVLGFLIYNANRSPMGLLQSGRPGPEGRTRPPGLVVADFMSRDFVIAGPEMTVEALLRALARLHIRPIALVIKDGQPLGMISRHAAEQVPEKERPTKTIADVMVAKGDIRTVKATDPLAAARRALEDGPETAVVLNDDVVVGLVSVSDIAHAMVLDR